MRKHNGTQLYGIQKILTTLKTGMNLLPPFHFAGKTATLR